MIVKCAVAIRVISSRSEFWIGFSVLSRIGKSPIARAEELLASAGKAAANMSIGFSGIHARK